MIFLLTSISLLVVGLLSVAVLAMRGEDQPGSGMGDEE